MHTDPIRIAGDAVRVDVLVVPNASRSHIVGVHGGRVKVRVSAPPERNKANEQVVAMLVDATAARRGKLVSGGGSRRKVIDLTGVTIEAVRAGLARDA